MWWLHPKAQSVCCLLILPHLRSDYIFLKLLFQFILSLMKIRNWLSYQQYLHIFVIFPSRIWRPYMWPLHLCETRFQERSLEINVLPFSSDKHENKSVSNVISILSKKCTCQGLQTGKEPSGSSWGNGNKKEQQDSCLDVGVFKV